MSEQTKSFRLFWRTGKTEIVRGNTPAEAMTLAGYSQGSIRALDFFAHGEALEYTWDAKEREWHSNNFAKVMKS